MTMDHEFYRCCVDTISLTKVNSYKGLLLGTKLLPSSGFYDPFCSHNFLCTGWCGEHQTSEASQTQQHKKVGFISRCFGTDTPMRDPTCKVHLWAQFSGISSPGCGVRQPPLEQAAQPQVFIYAIPRNLLLHSGRLSREAPAGSRPATAPLHTN